MFDRVCLRSITRGVLERIVGAFRTRQTAARSMCRALGTGVVKIAKSNNFRLSRGTLLKMGRSVMGGTGLCFGSVI